MIPPSLDVSTFLQSCSTEPSNSTATPTDAGEPEEAGDIPTSASTAGVLETLLAALQAANLVDDLAEPNGPFTLFAPSDEAFGTLPSGLVTCLLEPENSATLTNILTYHVVAGSFSSTNLEEGILPEMLNGEILTIAMDNGVTINDLVTIVTPDVSATNGVIHIIDSGKILLPSSQVLYVSNLM